MAHLPLTMTKDQEQYFIPKISPDMRLKCEWDLINDPKMEQWALHCACAGPLLDELCVLSMRVLQDHVGEISIP